jgi:O-antigen/teichoic acid export membrane protein
MKSSGLAQNTVLLALGMFLSKGLLFIMVPFFSSWLTTEDYGVFDLYTTYVLLLIPIISLASGEGIFRFSVETDDTEQKKKYISNGLLISLAGLAISTIVIFAIRLVFDWALAWPFLLLLAAEIFDRYLQSFLRGIKRLDLYSFGSALTVVLIILFVTILVRIIELQLEGIILGYGLGYILGSSVVFCIAKYWNYFSLRALSAKSVKTLIAYSYPLIASNVSWWVMTVSDRLLINLFIGATGNGIYAIANKVPAICSSVVSVFGISWQQSATEMVDSKERERYYNEIFNKLLLIILTLSACVLSLNFIFFDYIFDIKYSNARLYTPLLIASTVFFALANFTGGIQISLKQPKENSKTTIVAAILNFLINIALIRFIGLYAAAVSTLIAFAVLYYLRKYRLRNIVRLKVESKGIIVCGIFYLYLTIMSILEIQIVLNILNIFLSGVAFLYFNRNVIGIIATKILRRRQRD